MKIGVLQGLKFSKLFFFLRVRAVNLNSAMFVVMLAGLFDVMSVVVEECVTNVIQPFMTSSFSTTEKLGLMVVSNTFLPLLYLAKVEGWNKLVCMKFKKNGGSNSKDTVF